MTETQVVELVQSGLFLALKLGGPFLIVCLGVGIMIGMLQAVTQVQEQTLTFVPKFVFCGVVLALAGGWMLRETVVFIQQLMASAPTMLGG